MKTITPILFLSVLSGVMTFLGCRTVGPSHSGDISGTYRAVFRPNVDNELMRIELRREENKIDGVCSYYGEKARTGWDRVKMSGTISGEFSDGVLWLAMKSDENDMALLKLWRQGAKLSGLFADVDFEDLNSDGKISADEIRPVLENWNKPIFPIDLHRE